MTVLECTRQLGAAIQEDEIYIKYQMARQANDEGTRPCRERSASLTCFACR